MINLIIWSKDRAAQLDILLDSIRLFTPYVEPTVIYKASNALYKEAYDILFRRHGVEYLEENGASLKSLTLEALRKKSEVTGFSTDDTFIYDNPDVSGEDILGVFNDELTDVFSMRLGYNTIVQNPHDGSLQPRLRGEQVLDNMLRWNFNHYHPLHNYGYPFGLDMHFYRRDIIASLVHEVPWNTTNQLESALFSLRHRIRPFIMSPKISCAVNVPINNHSGVTISGKTYDYSPEWLNEQFLDGARFWPYYESKDIVGCHQELRLDRIS